MSSSQNHYTTLGVQSNADLPTIKRAYREKMRLYHPDKFVAELSYLKQSGSSAAVRQLEKKIDHAKQMTQRINAAYAVLVDEQTRADYDQHLSDERQKKYYAEQRNKRMRHYEGERRTVKSRPHHRNPNIPKKQRSETIPWAVLGGLIVLMLVATGLFSNAVTRSVTPFTTYVPRNPTAEGGIGMRDLQATTYSEQATYVARSTIVYEPTATARPSSENEALGDRMMRFELYSNAEDLYTEAIEADNDNSALYIKRAAAYVALFENGDVDARELALADYEQAILLDEAYAAAYLGRGLFYYQLWLDSIEYGPRARADLEQYLSLVSDENTEEIEAILATLPE